MTATTRPAILERLRTLPNPLAVELTLLSQNADVHDDIVGLRGAHAENVAAIEAFEDLEVRVTISVVVLPANVGELPALIRHWSGRQSTWLTLYHPEGSKSYLDDWKTLVLSPLIVSGSAFRESLSRLDASDLRDTSASRIPVCWVPEGKPLTWWPWATAKTGSSSFWMPARSVSCGRGALASRRQQSCFQNAWD
ncbi:MAG: hypothetical protein ACJAYU_000215 [Bradymonadia bacterium]|jgi:hypothetical protein